MSSLGVRLKLGFFPKTKKIEKRHSTLIEDYREYVEYSQSEELERFEQLNRYLNSPEFEEKENDPETDKSEINALKSEYAKLKKSPRLSLYFKNKAREARFTPVKQWKLEFEDNFSGEKLNEKIWLTRYYWGDKLLKEGYSLLGDQHHNTEGKNISVSGSVLSITTRKEASTGLVWNPAAGFIPQEFLYTSGVINTAKSYRQLYGKIEAKVKVPKGSAYHAFWLAGEQTLPHVNIFKYTRKKFYIGNFWGNMTESNGVAGDITALSGAFAGRSYIFTLEWAPKKLIWSVNGVVFKEVYHGVPDEPMYIAFGSGMEEDVSPLSRPLKLEIDWVRFYSKV
jgi:beta-glucanase (GH16 family)